MTRRSSSCRSPWLPSLRLRSSNAGGGLHQRRAGGFARTYRGRSATASSRSPGATVGTAAVVHGRALRARHVEPAPPVLLRLPGIEPYDKARMKPRTMAKRSQVSHVGLGASRVRRRVVEAHRVVTSLCYRQSGLGPTGNARRKRRGRALTGPSASAQTRVYGRELGARRSCTARHATCSCAKPRRTPPVSSVPPAGTPGTCTSTRS